MCHATLHQWLYSVTKRELSREEFHSSSHILNSYVFECCRAQADVAASENVPMDLSMLGKGKTGKGDKNGKGKNSADAGEYFAGCCLGCKACCLMKKEC